MNPFWCQLLLFDMILADRKSNSTFCAILLGFCIAQYCPGRFLGCTIRKIFGSQWYYGQVGCTWWFVDSGESLVQ